jgi:hypothetical protein
MAERGITEADVETALRQPIGDPLPGQPGSVVLQGYAPGGRILNVCVRAADHDFVITAYWR